MRLYAALSLSLALLLAGCTGPEQPARGPTDGHDGHNGQQMAPVQVTSPAFQNGTAIPREFTCDGENRSPPLQFNMTGGNVTHWALIVTDPDATNGTFTHWAWWDLPANVTYIGDGQNLTQLGAVEGLNSAGRAGYVGPCPPSGTHRYEFHVYALSGPVALPSVATVEQVKEHAKGKAVGHGILVGTYARGSA
ncbi:MAG TPA: YbhB/YbcL family Raf kinase inhibitor-like protein [Candidatus Thermoplasmatota archaeon]|nr:YbhB/YbcL family Raf kinase inhibitor-like protein [Candidatus Thermoplasmatota archaeon]